MTDRPILFSAPMVRALLSGRKTQTRRVLKVPETWIKDLVEEHATPEVLKEYSRFAVGDRLWVRESGKQLGYAKSHDPVLREDIYAPCGFFYTADGATIYMADEFEGHDYEQTRPSIHMPRWASRLTLTVTDVRVQRLQDIDGIDACEEGARWLDEGRGAEKWGVPDVVPYERGLPRDAFAALWKSIHGPDAWEANPWIVALTFSVERRNVDAAAPAIEMAHG